MNGKLKKEQHLFDINIFCYKDTVNVFTIRFDQFNASFLKKKIQLFVFVYIYSSQHLKWIKTFHQSCPKMRSCLRATLVNIFDPLQMSTTVYNLTIPKLLNEHYLQIN